MCREQKEATEFCHLIRFARLEALCSPWNWHIFIVEPTQKYIIKRSNIFTLIAHIGKSPMKRTRYAKKACKKISLGKMPNEITSNQKQLKYVATDVAKVKFEVCSRCVFYKFMFCAFYSMEFSKYS